jgi:hypothetical protein
MASLGNNQGKVQQQSAL